jgi:ketosteroid isomerase-like protein
MPEKSATPDLEERLRESVEAGNRGDFDAAVAVFSAEAVWDRSPVGQEVIEGRDAIRDFFADWSAIFEDYVLGVEEFHDLGRGVTLSLMSQRGRPRGGSGLVEEPYAAVVRWKDGLVAHVTVYPDIDDARAGAERLAEDGG